MEGLGSAVPSGKHTIGITYSADPYITTRIFKQTKYVISGKPVSDGIDRFGTDVADLLEAGQGRVANKPLTGVHPPFTDAVLERDLVPAPAPISHSLWQGKPHRVKSVAIELAD